MNKTTFYKIRIFNMKRLLLNNNLNYLNLLHHHQEAEFLVENKINNLFISLLLKIKINKVLTSEIHNS